ncbi:peptide methionine sulfoxide reductase MsrA [Peptococcaceae bacterium DYL19]|nr:peptide methionine sulfoxide reductase MsrA [Phosphitispora fastidiosa]
MLTYEEVCAGGTGHYEAVQITYNPAVISYDKLLEIFWRQVNPTDPGGSYMIGVNHTERQSSTTMKSRS